MKADMVLKEKLKKLLLERAVKSGRFTLSSGKTSDFYIDGKQITLDPEGANLTAQIILEKIKGLPVNAVGGLTLGADPIASAVSVLSAQTNRPLPAFIVRKKTKEHGLQKEIEGIIEPGWKVVIVEDIATTGVSALTAIQAVEKIGCQVVKVICLVDREEGAAEALKDYDFDPIFKRSELMPV